MTGPSPARRSYARAAVTVGALLVPLLFAGPTHADEPLEQPAPTGAVSPTPGGDAERGRPDTVLSVEETDCVETTVNRAAALGELRRRVPTRYGLDEIAPGAGRITVVAVRCTVSVEGHPARVTTSSYVVAPVRTGDGLPGSNYLLAHGVDNPELAARYRAAGLPTQWQPDTTAVETTTSGADGVTWRVVGDGMDHVLTAATRYVVPPDTPVSVTTVRYFHDGPRGDLVLTFSNRLQQLPGGAPVFADFTTADDLVPLFFSAAQQRVNGSRFPSFRGEWTTVLSRLSRADGAALPG